MNLTSKSFASKPYASQLPENYGNLRVRVTGFSDYFVKLKESIQDDIIERTTHKC